MMIFERSQAVYFKDLKDGETFICPAYGSNRLFVKACSLSKADANSFDLQLNQPHWFGNDVSITPVKVKIVEVK
jgi:hypothetical protein